MVRPARSRCSSRPSSPASPISTGRMRGMPRLTAPERSWRSISLRSSPTGACCVRHPSGPVAGVVKADAYGLGAAAVAPALYAAGCRHFFVALLDEALAHPRPRPRRDARRAGRAASRQRAGLPRARPDPGARLARRRSMPGPRPRAVSGARCRRCCTSTPACRGLASTRANWQALRQDHGRLAGIDLRYVMTHLVASEGRRRPGQPAAARALRRRLRRLAAGAAQLRQFLRHLPRRRLGLRPGPARRGAVRHQPDARRGQPDAPDGAAARPRAAGARGAARRRASATTPPGAPRGRAGSPPSRSATPTAGIAACPDRGRAFFDGKPVPLVGRVSMDLTTFDVTEASRASARAPGWSSSARRRRRRCGGRGGDQRLRGADLARPPLPPDLSARVNPLLDMLAAIGRGVIGACRVTGSLALFAATGLSHLVRPPFYRPAVRAARCWRSAISACRWWR